MKSADDLAGHRYQVLDAWRGICALLVAFVHVPVAHAWQNAEAFHSLQLFVDFFFVLSGFVICHAYGRRLDVDRDWPGFMIRRFGRVWPLHAAVLAGFAVIELLKLAAQAFTQLQNKLQSDSRTSQSLYYSSDITYAN